MFIVINRCYGGFSLSKEACEMLNTKSKFSFDNDRTNKKLINCVKILGEKASGSHSKLKIEEIPDNATDWEINDYDGFESIIYVIEGEIHHLY